MLLNLTPEVVSKSLTHTGAEEFVLLLDGFDTLYDEGDRIRFIESVEEFRKEYNVTPVVIASRPPEASELMNSFEAWSTIKVAPLETLDVQSYLKQFGERFVQIEYLIQNDTTLGELSRNPFWLSMMAYVYLKKGSINRLSGLQRQKEILFQEYVNHVLASKPNDGKRKKNFDDSTFEKSISWLAGKMRDTGNDLFFIERLTPDWFSKRDEWSSYRFLVGFNYYLIYASASFVVGLGHIAMLVGGMVGFRHAFQPIKIKLTQRLAWSWGKFWQYSPPVFLASTVVAFMWYLGGSTVSEVAGGFMFICGWLVSFIGFSVYMSLSSEEIPNRFYPTQVLQSSRNNAIRLGFITGITVCIVSFTVYYFLIFYLGNQEVSEFIRNFLQTSPIILIAERLGVSNNYEGIIQSLAFSLFMGVAAGLTVALDKGGEGLIRHQATKIAVGSHTPLKLIDFLNYASEIKILQRIGGGYAFVHSELQDYFIAKNGESGEDSQDHRNIDKGETTTG